jgi:hypothetical protein
VSSSKRKSSAVVLSLLAVVLASTGCAQSVTTGDATGATVHAEANPAARFDHYRTFSFGTPENAPPGYLMAKRSVEVERRLQGLVEAALTEKGYLPAFTPRGDIVILFGTGQRDVQTHQQSDVGGEWLASDENTDSTEGKLVIDVFDGATKTHLWHGSSRETVNPDRINDQRLRAYVHELFSSFPDAKVRPGAALGHAAARGSVEASAIDQHSASCDFVAVITPVGGEARR